jgi:hypothetical protein
MVIRLDIRKGSVVVRLSGNGLVEGLKDQQRNFRLALPGPGCCPVHLNVTAALETDWLPRILLLKVLLHRKRQRKI